MALCIEHCKIETAHNQSCLGEFEFMKAISTLFIGKVNEIQFQYLTQGQYLRRHLKNPPPFSLHRWAKAKFLREGENEWMLPVSYYT